MLNCLKFSSILLYFSKIWSFLNFSANYFIKFSKFFKSLWWVHFCWMSPLPSPKFWRRHCSTWLEWNSCIKFCPRSPPEPKSWSRYWYICMCKCVCVYMCTRGVQKVLTFTMKTDWYRAENLHTVLMVMGTNK